MYLYDQYAITKMTVLRTRTRPHLYTPTPVKVQAKDYMCKYKWPIHANELLAYRNLELSKYRPGNMR